MHSFITKLAAWIMSIASIITMFTSILGGKTTVADLRPYTGGRMQIENVDFREDAVYFTADGVSCVLQFTEPHGWRLRTAKEDGSFDDFGAGQTLARDLGVLVKGGYKVQKIQPVDMFPFTEHIESVVKLTRAGS